MFKYWEINIKIVMHRYQSRRGLLPGVVLFDNPVADLWEGGWG